MMSELNPAPPASDGSAVPQMTDEMIEDSHALAVSLRRSAIEYDRDDAIEIIGQALTDAYRDGWNAALAYKFAEEYGISDAEEDDAIQSWLSEVVAEIRAAARAEGVREERERIREIVYMEPTTSNDPIEDAAQDIFRDRLLHCIDTLAAPETDQA